MEIVLVSIILGATILLFFYISKIFNNSKGSPETAVTQEEQDEIVNNAVKNEPAGNNKTKKKIIDKKQKDKGFTFQHPWLVSTLKGHSGRVLGLFTLFNDNGQLYILTDMDLSANGKYLASSSEDRTVLVWHSKDFSAKEHKCLRCNVEFDHGVFVRWSPDSKAFVVQKAVQVRLHFKTSNTGPALLSEYN